MARTILGVLAGLITAWLVLSLVDFAAIQLHHPEPGTDLRNLQALATYISSTPVGVRLLTLAGWMLAALLGGWIAARIARFQRTAACIVGAFVIVAVAAKTLLLPYPLWTAIAGILLPLPATWLGIRLAANRTPSPTA